MTTRPGPGGGRASLSPPTSGLDELSKLVRGLLAVLAAVAGVMLATGVAWAYWSAGGAGTGSAGTGSLAAPSNVAASAPVDSATVSVSWTGVQGRSGVPVDGYYVQRHSGGTPSPACGSSPGALLAGASTSCSDTGVGDGTYTYVVTAVYGSWTASSDPSTPAPVSSVQFAVQAPAGAVAGTPFSVTVTAQDGAGTLLPGYRGTVRFSTSDANSPVLPVDYAFKNPDNGGKTFTNGVELHTAGSQTMTVQEVGAPARTGSATVAVSAGAATKVVFSSQPGGGISDVAWSAQPQVTVQDAWGNTNTLSSASVTLSIASGTGGAVLTCTTNPRTATAGVAGFAGCRIDKAGTFTLQASSGGLTSATSASFTVLHGPAVKVGFTTQPSTEVAGSPISPDVVVTVQDAAGNTVTASSATVSLAIGTNPGGGTLSGTASRAAVSGVATFPGLSINKTGTGYTLTAASTGLTGATSVAFDITPGQASQLAFSVQPGGGTGGTAWATQPRVLVQDAFGNTVITSTATVTLTISTDPGPGNLAGTASVAASAGLVTYAGLSIDKAANGYQLTASSGGLTSAVSNTFNITVGPVTHLVFVGQPPNPATAGTAFSTVIIGRRDAGGNATTGGSTSVTVAFDNNPGGSTLSGTTVRSITAGTSQITFTSLSINKTGVGYRLRATATGLTQAVSNSFTVNPGAASNVIYTAQPGGGTGGTTWAAQPQVTIRDANQNVVTTSSANVTLSIQTGTAGAVLTCTANSVAASAGVATFAGCRIDKSGTYTIRATSGALTVDSTSVMVTVGPAARLGYSVQPTNVVAGSAISPAVEVFVQDAGGNTVTSSSANVTLAIQNNAGGGTLSGTLTVAASSGVASFSNVSIDKAGSGYTLNATSSGLTNIVSTGFNVTAAAAVQLVFTTQPSNGSANVALATQPVVAIRDAYGNATTSTANVTLAITSGTGTSGAILTCTSNPVTAVSGTATFAGCRIDRAGTGYTLRATSGVLVPATSNALNIV